MTDAIALSQLSAATLPTRKVRKGVLDYLLHFREISNREGGLVPIATAAAILGVSKQRVHDLVREGTLRTTEIYGKKWLSGNELESFVKLQRKAGRPWKEPSVKEMWRAALDGTREQWVDENKS
ncbi:MAG: hypothetical protein HZA90_00620 [Verrucomicrobia bacterium]|nr:hypothetical protein [Verrucomicrobiota bacterium]